MGARLDVTYKHDRRTGTPRYVCNDDIQRVAEGARRQVAGDDRLRIGPDDLLAIDGIDANGIRYDLAWSVDGPVTNEAGEPVLGLCEHDADGLPGTALIFANPDAVGGIDGLLISTLAHELGHGVFDAPGWIVAAGTADLFDATPTRRFRSETPNEQHLSPAAGRLRPNFPEWRANEFMGSLLVPRALLAVKLQHCAAALKLPLAEVGGGPSLITDRGAQPLRIPPSLPRHECLTRLPAVIHELAQAFGVTRRFMEVRLLRYGLIHEDQLILS